jgi:hypothetical protein
MTQDPLVHDWRGTLRPLNWQAWQGVSAAERARMRCRLMEDLRYFDSLLPHRPSFWWVHTHRELLEIKAATGHACPLLQGEKA